MGKLKPGSRTGKNERRGGEVEERGQNEMIINDWANWKWNRQKLNEDGAK